MIVYDVLITIGILYIIYICISKTVPLKKILQKHYKLFIIVFIALLIIDNIIGKNILSNPYVYIIYNNLRISIVYVLILFLNQKTKNMP